jgi:hypothetical protein
VIDNIYRSKDSFLFFVDMFLEISMFSSLGFPHFASSKFPFQNLSLAYKYTNAPLTKELLFAPLPLFYFGE